MTQPRTCACAALLAILAGWPPARAEGPSPFVTRLMDRVPSGAKTFACFTRTYDLVHLAAHPGQNVTWMQVLAVAYRSLDYHYQLRIGFRFRGRPEALATVAECGGHDPADARGEAVCAGPGPAGSQVKLGPRRSLLITMPPGIHLWKPDATGPQDTVDDAFGSDDRLLRLDRVPLAQCLDQGFDDEKAFLARSR